MRDDRLRSLEQDQSGAKDRRGAGAPAGRQDLGRRLDSLPDGHPSSRNEADGTPRAPAARLRDLDPWPDAADNRAFTDPEWSGHIKEVRTRLADAHREGLATDRLHTIDPNGQAWTKDRRQAQDQIINDLYAKAKDVPNQYRAIIAGGIAGSGKTTVLADHAGIDRSEFMTINPDDIKAEMARRGLVPEVEGLSPLEASDLVHEESSYVARQLALRAQADGKNVIWDITMSDPVKTQKRIDSLRAAGYGQVDGIFVDVSIDVSLRRADARHREGEDDYRSGKGHGGRYVPPELTIAQEDDQWGCKNRRTFEELKPCFDSWALFDNGVDGRDPIMVAADMHGYEPKEPHT
jgi:predicted ABC-type ATPase